MRADKKTIYFRLSIALVLGIVIAILLFSKGGGLDKTKKSEIKAEIVLEQFYSALKAGDFETAKSLCDTVTMLDYLDNYKHNWDLLSKKDSAEFTAILSTLANIRMTIENIEEQDGVCFIDYTLSLENINNSRKATAKKEKGVWKVAEITNTL